MSDELRAVPTEDDPIERWLRSEVVAAYDAFKADPGGVRTVDQVRQGILERRGRTQI